jgi:hypothetical protein
MSSEIDFSGQYSYSVLVHQDDLGDLGEATLLFGAEHWPHLRFEDSQSYDRLGDGKKYGRLRATTKDGETFTLLDCSVTGFYLSIDYVVAGNVTERFKCIGIRFNDISEWFMPFRSVEEKIKLDSENPDRYKKISATVKTDKQSFNFFSEPILRVRKSGEDHVVHEHILFSFERIDGSFFAKDLRSKTHELSTLLSILIARPLYLVNVQVTCDDGGTYYVFFSSFKKREQDTPAKYWAEYFITKPALDGRWQDIFDNYYKSEYREISWVRLAGMQRYDGFWEYRALGYVSLLDKYVSQRSEGQKRKLSKAEDIRDTKAHAALLKISPRLTGEQESAVFSVIEEFFLGGRKLSFRHKYDYALSTMDKNIRSIINLSDSDFIKIKEIRDAIAHGEAPDLIDANYGRIEIVVSKIALLLTYWAFMDFGLKNEDFLSCLRSHSPLHLRADIDRVQLARVTKTAGFFSVSKIQFDQLSQIKGIKVQACFLQYSDGCIEYADHHVAAFKAWMRKSLSGVIPVVEIFGQSIEKIKFFGQAYIECGTERLELAHAYFIEST